MVRLQERRLSQWPTSRWDSPAAALKSVSRPPLYTAQVRPLGVEAFYWFINNGRTDVAFPSNATVIYGAWSGTWPLVTGGLGKSSNSRAWTSATAKGRAVAACP